MMTFTHKLLLNLVAGAAVMTIAGCGATTGGVAQSIAARTVATKPMTPTQRTVVPTTPSVDASATCEQLSVKMAELDAEIAQNQALVDTNTGRNIGDDALNAGASYGLAKSGILNRVPFGGSLARSAMNAKRNARAQKAADAQAMLQDAAIRKSSAAGLYAGKSCS
jgi:hypothetical protein